MKLAPLALASALLLSPALASATIDTPYAPTKCIGVDKPTNALFTGANAANRTASRILNPSSSPITIICPVTKTTSGPDIETNDMIDSIDIVVTPNGGTLACTMHIWRSDIERAQAHGSHVYSYSTSSPFTGSMAIRPTFGISAFWSNYGPQTTPPEWEYVDMECVLPAGASIGTYTVHEVGTQQPGRIFPASNCYPDATNETGPWRYIQNSTAAQEINGGRIYFAASGTTTHVFRCPVPNNVSVEFSVLPSALGMDVNNPQVLGCNIDTLPSGGVTWGATSSGSGTAPFQVLPLSSQTSILTPTSGTHELVCGQKLGGVGDGSLISYRTMPPISHTNPVQWTGTASSSDGADVPARAVDNDTGSRWTSGHAQSEAASQYFQVDTKASRPIRQIVMSTTNNDYPRNFKVYVSATDSGWSTATPVYTGTGTSNTVAARFAAKTGRYIRVVATTKAGVGNWWSIHNLNVYQ